MVFGEDCITLAMRRTERNLKIQTQYILCLCHRQEGRSADMGQKPMRECHKIGCHTLTRETYCTKHRSEYIKREAQRQQRYDRHTRNASATEFYKSAAWQKARALSIAAHYGLCQDCLEQGRFKRADMVHHVKPLRDYPELALEQSNLRPLCNRCHGKY